MIIAIADMTRFKNNRNVIFDNTEPCQSNNRKNQCCSGLIIMTDDFSEDVMRRIQRRVNAIETILIVILPSDNQ